MYCLRCITGKERTKRTLDRIPNMHVCKAIYKKKHVSLCNSYSIMNMIRAISRRRGMLPPSYSLLYFTLSYLILLNFFLHYLTEVYSTLLLIAHATPLYLYLGEICRDDVRDTVSAKVHFLDVRTVATGIFLKRILLRCY